jgi:ribose transport system ATP-binding protein
LQNLDLDVRPGEVHALLGENGSGKSTFIKILAGYHAPDPGASLKIRGQEVHLPLSVRDPAHLGIGFVHQDLALINSATVLENLRVGRFETGIGWRISWRSERRVARRALERFGLHIDPDATVSKLTAVERAMLAIARALEQLKDASRGILVLDEPTAYLPRDGVDRLFQSIKEVASGGFGVLFISHRLDEVQAISDRVTVLRDGRRIATTPTAELSEDELIRQILGFALPDLYPEPHKVTGDPCFGAQLLSPGGSPFSLEATHGEVVGLTGLLGTGYEEVPYALFGATPASGHISVDGQVIDLHGFTPRAAIRAGLALLPAQRLEDGAVGEASVLENITLATLGRYFSRGWLRGRREMRESTEDLRRFSVRPAEPRRTFATLSGGNQQKVLLAKWFATNPRVLLLHEPVQGVDVGAKREIFDQIRESAERGAVVIVASSEYEDLAHLCDRVLVFRQGRVVAKLHGESLTHERILDYCFRES